MVVIGIARSGRGCFGMASKLRNVELWNGRQRSGGVGYGVYGKVRIGRLWKCTVGFGDSGRVKFVAAGNGNVGQGMAVLERNPMSKKWAITDGAPYKQKDAPIIGEALEAIETERGIVTPIAVVEVASNKKSPLHRFFDWDNESASDKWRLHQARNLIGSVRVVIESDAGPVSGRAYYHIRTEDEGDNARNYMNTDNIMSHEELKARLIQQALDEGERWMERYKSIKELAGVFDALRLAKKNVARKRRKVA